MNTEMLSETQKRIVNQELFRKLVLNEVKTRVSKKDYNIIVENYDLLLQHHISGPDILSEGVKDLFVNMIQGIKKLGDKLNPDDAEANFELGKYYHYFGTRQSEEKRLEDAMPFYNRALELAPELFESFPEILAKMNK